MNLFLSNVRSRSGIVFGLALGLSLISAPLASAAEVAPYMVEDINTSGSSDPNDLTEMDGILYFTAKGGGRGRELWRSDGTATGTFRVKDINPGGNGSSPFMLRPINGLLYFAADDGVHGQEPWVSDGTSVGTRIVADVAPNAADSDPLWFTAYSGGVYFSADDGLSGRELWRTDGTAPGTRRIKDIAPGAGNSDPLSLASFAGKLFFLRGSDTNVDQVHTLYVTDGTAKGTRPFRSSAGRLIRDVTHELVVVNSVMYFEVDDGEVWSSLGTHATTRKIANRSAQNFVSLSGQTYFNAWQGALMRTDGTKAGTTLVKHIVTDWGDGPLDRLISTGTQLVFDSIGGPWVSDGTAAGTHAVGTDIQIDSDLVTINGLVFFIGWSDSFPAAPASPTLTPGPTVSLWRTDGTVDGTRSVGPDTYMSELTVVGGSIFYKSSTQGFGWELWRYVP